MIEERDQFKLPCLSLSWTLSRNDSMTSKIYNDLPSMSTCQVQGHMLKCISETCITLIAKKYKIMIVLPPFTVKYAVNQLKSTVQNVTVCYKLRVQ